MRASYSPHFDTCKKEATSVSLDAVDEQETQQRNLALPIPTYLQLVVHAGMSQPPLCCMT